MTRQSRVPREVWVRAVADLGLGESVRSVAQRHGVGVSGLGYWRRKLRGGAPFIPVALERPTQGEAHSGALEVSIGGTVIRFGQDVSPAYVARLVTALRSS